MFSVKLILILCFTVCGFCAPQKKVIFQKVEVETDNQFITMQVTLRNNTNGDVVADVDANLLQDLDTTLFVTNVVSKRLSKNDYNPLMKSGRVNLCEFFKNPEKEQFLKTFFVALRHYGDLMFSCPMKKGHFSLKSFEMNTEFLPSFTPLGDYRVDFAILRKTANGSLAQVYRMIWYAAVVVQEP